MTTITTPASATHAAHHMPEKKWPQPRPIFLLKMFLYVATGILQPIMIDSMRVKSCLGRKALLLPTLAKTTGMALVGVLSTSADRAVLRRLVKTDNEFRRSLLLAAFVDLISGMMLTGGILLTGGAVFVVLYNSCPAWTALLSKYFLGRPLSSKQTVGVLIVCAGLIFNVFGTTEQLKGGSSGKVATVTFGSAIVLMGCVLHSAFFVLSDRSLRGVGQAKGSAAGGACHHNCSSNDKSGSAPVISPPLWSSCLGTMEAICMLIYVLMGINTRGFQEPDISPDICALSDFARGFSFMLLVDAVHSAAFFLMLKQIGAVGSALLKGIQSVAVVLLSAAFFCPQEEAQCLTVIKAGSVVLVLSGTFLYAAGSSADGKKLKPIQPEPTKGEQSGGGDKDGLPSVELESLLDT